MQTRDSSHLDVYSKTFRIIWITKQWICTFLYNQQETADYNSPGDENIQTKSCFYGRDLPKNTETFWNYEIGKLNRIHSFRKVDMSTGYLLTKQKIKHFFLKNSINPWANHNKREGRILEQRKKIELKSSIAEPVAKRSEQKRINLPKKTFHYDLCVYFRISVLLTETSDKKMDYIQSLVLCKELLSK